MYFLFYVIYSSRYSRYIPRKRIFFRMKRTGSTRMGRARENLKKKKNEETKQQKREISIGIVVREELVETFFAVRESESRKGKRCVLQR